MRTDFGTTGFAQWFYFRFSNTRKGQAYKFNIMNMTKPDSLYNQGMRVLTYSTKSAEECKAGWTRDGSDVAYYRNAVTRKCGYYTLTFSVTTRHDQDCVFVASSYPYTYTDLLKFCADHCVDRDVIRRTTLCKTLAGNDCPLFIVTDFSSPPEDISKRPAVIFTARVHPGFVL